MSPEMEIIKFLGKGSYGSVDLCRYRKSDGSVLYTAMKTNSVSQRPSRDSLVREFRILSELRGCPGIVQLSEKNLLEGIDHDGNRVYMMPMEYASAGTLSDLINRNRKQQLSDSTIRGFTRMILQGLVSIHSRGYVHCDLKPDNLLLFPRYDQETWDFSYELKISDFGLSIKAGGISYCWEVDYPFVGTPIYMSPDSVDDGSVERALDLWSVGCIVLEMYTGKRPWFGVSLDGLQGLLAEEQKAPEIPETLPCDARQFLNKCFALKPMERGSASELLLHPFLIGDVKKVTAVSGGERRRVGLRIRKPPERFEDIANSKKPLKLVGVNGGDKRKRLVLRIRRKPPTKSKDVPKKPLKLKIISPKPQLFKKMSNKLPIKVKFLSS